MVKNHQAENGNIESNDTEGCEASRARPRRKRGNLSKDLIISTALQVIDRGGLKALSMRRLGTSLSASTMGVYRHFSNKSELLDAIIDRVLEGLVSVPLQGSWQEQLRVIGLRVRDVMLDHPELAPMMGAQFRRSDTSLIVNAEIIAQLAEAGLPESILAEVYWAIAVYTNGYVILESRGGVSAERGRVKRTRAHRLGKWQRTLSAVTDIPAPSAEKAASVFVHPIDDVQFLFGLDCLISGIEKRIESQEKAARIP